MKGKQVPETTSSATDVLKAGNRVVALGIAAIVAILLIAAVLLFANLPDANAFNAKVERIFVENDDLRAGAELLSALPPRIVCAHDPVLVDQQPRLRAPDSHERRTQPPHRTPPRCRAIPPG